MLAGKRQRPGGRVAPSQLRPKQPRELPAPLFPTVPQRAPVQWVECCSHVILNEVWTNHQPPPTPESLNRLRMEHPIAFYSQYILKCRKCSPRPGSRQCCRSLRRKCIQLRKLCSQNHFRLVRPIFSISFFLHCVHFHYIHVHFLSFSRQMYQYYLFHSIFTSDFD